MAKKVQYSDVLGEQLANDLIKKFTEMGKKSIDAYIKELQAGLKKINLSDTVSSKSLKAQSGAEAQIENTKKQLRDLTELEKEYRRIKQSTEKLDAKITVSAPNSIARLNAEMNKNIALRRQMATTDPGFKKITNEIVNADQKLKAFDAQIGRHQRNVGNYKSALSGLGSSLAGLVSSYLSVYTVIQLVQNIFENTRALDSLAFSYKALIKDTSELAQTQGFLADISEKYGLNLLSTSQSYLKFRASIVGTNFSLQESEKLFGSVAKAGATLGLRADRMELVFLALEQMISKGTISTEELRRQLGDLLPGSMRIMANALGVTIPKLLDMVKANKVLAEDALPKFRVELEKAYGIESVERIDTLQASVGRLQTQWIKLVEALNASSIASGVVNLITSLVKLFTLYNLEAEVSTKFSTELKSVTEELQNIKDDNIFTATLLEKIQQTTDEIGKLGMEIIELKKLGAAVAPENSYIRQTYTEATESYLAAKKLRSELQSWLADPTKIRKAIIDEPEPLLGFIQEIEDRIKELGEFIKASRNKTEIIKYQDEIDNLKKLQDYYKNLNFKTGAVEDVRDRFKEVSDAIYSAKILGWSPDRIAGMEAEQTELASLIRAYNAYNALSILNKKPKINGRPSPDLLGMDEALKNVKDREDEIARDRENFGERIGLIDKATYDNELRWLKEFHEESKLTDDQYLAQRVALWIQYNEKIIDSAANLYSEFLGLADQIFQGLADEAQREMDLHEEKVDSLKSELEKEKELKDRGAANDYDRLVSQLGSEQRLRDSAQKKYEKYQKRQAQLKFLETQANLGVSVAEAFAANAGEGPVGWIVAIAAAAALISSFVSMQNQIKNVGRYAEGTESLEGPGTTTSDSIPAMLSRKERVVPAKINEYLKGISNEELPALAMIYKMNGLGEVPDRSQVYSSYSEVVSAIEESTDINRKILHKPDPKVLDMGDSYLIIWDKYTRERVMKK